MATIKEAAGRWRFHQMRNVVYHPCQNKPVRVHPPPLSRPLYMSLPKDHPQSGSRDVEQLSLLGSSSSRNLVTTRKSKKEPKYWFQKSKQVGSRFEPRNNSGITGSRLGSGRSQPKERKQQSRISVFGNVEGTSAPVRYSYSRNHEHWR